MKKLNVVICSYPDKSNGQQPIWAEYAIVDAKDHTFRIEFRQVPIDARALVKSVQDSHMPNADWWLTLRYGPSFNINHY